MHITDIPFDAVGFDNDGTLIETEQILYHAWQELTAREGITFGMADYVHIIGKKDHDCCRIVSDRFGLGKDIDSWHKEYAAIVRRMIDEDLMLRPGALEILEAFRMHGVPMALVTMGTMAHAERTLKKFALLSKFQTIVAADSPDLDALKPDPAPYLLAARRLGVRADRCIVFEDSPTGVRSALDAGCFVFAIPHAHSPASRLRDAHVVLDSLSDFRTDMVRFP